MNELVIFLSKVPVYKSTKLLLKIPIYRKGSCENNYKKYIQHTISGKK